MRIQTVVPESEVTAPVLDAALEPVTRLNEQLLANGTVPTIDTALKNGAIKWAPEPPGAERFDHASTVMKRGWGDCDDLAPWAAATLRHTGEDPGAVAVVKRSGLKKWHAVVQRSDGTIDDPSRRAGMGKRDDGAGPAATPPMFAVGASLVGGAYEVRPQLAVRRIDVGSTALYQARTDIPWVRNQGGKPSPTDYAMATLHTAPTAATALTGSIVGAIKLARVGGYAMKKHLQRVAAIADACSGCGEDLLFRKYGREHAEAAVDLVEGFGLNRIGAGAATYQQAAQAIMQHPEASPDEQKIAALVNKHANGQRPTPGTLTHAVLQYLQTTQGPVTPGSAEDHGRLLLADQVAKHLMVQLQSQGVVGFDFGSFISDVGKGIGSAANAVGKAVAKVAPVVAQVASVIPPPYGTAISLAAGAVGKIAGALTGGGGGGGGGASAATASAAPGVPGAAPGAGVSRICIPVTFG